MNAVVEKKDVATSNNPFGSQMPVRSGQNATAEAGQQREIAEVQAAMVIAKRFPRNQIEAMDRILQACTRPSLAEGALYSYARGGTDITGPSIRLAEVAAQAWGNIQFGVRELEQRNGESTVEAFAWDVETNTRQVKTFQVEHKRHTKRGSYALTDPRDIYELVANQGARRLRACILGIVPGDVIEAAVRECENTMRASADTSPEGLKKLVAAFEVYGVTQQQIEGRIQSRLEAIRPAQVVQLKKVYASLRDGMSQVADWFETDNGTADLTDQIKSGKKPTERDAQKVRSAIEKAKDSDALAEAADMIREVAEADRPALMQMYEARRAELEGAPTDESTD